MLRRYAPSKRKATPFRSPLLARTNGQQAGGSAAAPGGSRKRSRTEATPAPAVPQVAAAPPPKTKTVGSSGGGAARAAKPSFAVPRFSSPQATAAKGAPGKPTGGAAAAAAPQYFQALWTKLSKKKHKTWENDAILEISGRKAVLRDMEGKILGKANNMRAAELEDLSEGATLSMAGKEVQLQDPIPTAEYESGRCFLSASTTATATAAMDVDRAPQGSKGLAATTSRAPAVVGASKQAKFKRVLAGGAAAPQGRAVAAKPRHEVQADSCVMPRPPPHHEALHNPQGKMDVVDVVIDPYLNRHLRKHQREGVEFMYKCALGYEDHGGCGAILADEMGLGKTLQSITLIWTLLRQGPYNAKPVIRRALVVCPSSLVGNWQAEFKRWLGPERIQVYGVNNKNTVVDFQLCATYQVLVISYEMFLRSSAELQKLKFGLLICDEAHRLKNSKIKTTSCLATLVTLRRVALTGTPVQNDLHEFYSLIDFVNPGFLSSYSCFRRVYEVPILASRQPKATPADVELGTKRAEEFASLIARCYLRRTSKVNRDFLPPKTEKVLFVPPTALQLRLYRFLIKTRAVTRCLDGRGGGDHLTCIAWLKMLCNSPRLLYDLARQAQEGNDAGSPLFELAALFDDDAEQAGTLKGFPGSKLELLMQMLAVLRGTEERVVVVSNSTKCLDVIEGVCKRRAYKCARLDGRVSSGKRMDIVNRFNDPSSDQFVFLLSTKAGGTGLNLVGASRLFLFDLDWNPAHDLQAMARIWRDGQKRDVHIYRLITAGTIEEKIYQRQVSKQGLSEAISDTKSEASAKFSAEDLRDLFKLHTSKCLTHELLKCGCDKDGTNVEQGHKAAADTKPKGGAKSRAGNLNMGELFAWQHYALPCDVPIPDDVLPEIPSSQATFLMANFM